jgi:hypothetical protein
MRLYFIRHAQSTNNALFDSTGAEQGRSDDPELSDLGVRQAKRLAQHILETKSGLEPGGFGLTHLYASPMVRAAHTASEISSVTGLKLHLWEDWHETGGIWLDNANGERIGREGKNRSYLEQRVFGKNCSSVMVELQIALRSSVTGIFMFMSWQVSSRSRLVAAKFGGRSTTPQSPALITSRTNLNPRCSSIRIRFRTCQPT